MNDFLKYLNDAIKDVKVEKKKEDFKQKKVEYDLGVEIGETIINYRKQLKLTQKQLSQITGITQANISKIETGSYVPSLQVLKKIADGLGCRLVVNIININNKEG